MSSSGETSPVITILPVGPMAAKTRAPARSAARRLIATPARASSATREPRPWRSSTKRLAPNVFVRMISLPAWT
ncbi:MAG: hypothetical protein NTV86_07130 [Planctomycetota bacterium]|nr:hypothetical protein [Planctomycetota bacterium]